ncbi:MAG: Uma2 family endonuclease, partial [Microscillaceae bacterium]|nr:Uma2 family endonuclease [Microscillaceae bacterium]
MSAACIQLDLFPDYRPVPQSLALAEATVPYGPVWEKFNYPESFYPSNDGKPMSENTLHFLLLVTLKYVLDCLFDHDENVLVAGDLLIYPLEGDIQKRMAPDMMVVFGRPRMPHRGSYIMSKEEGVPPAVVFEIASPSNYKDKEDLGNRYDFYNRLGVKEYFVIHTKPSMWLEVFVRIEDNLERYLPFLPHESPFLG